MAKVIKLEQPEKLELQHKPDDDHLAVHLAQRWSHLAAYFRNSWHVYENGVWGSRDVHELKRSIRQFLRDYRAVGVKVSQSQINALAQMMEDEVYIPDRAMIEHEACQDNYINLRNGMYNLVTGELEPHDPGMYFTHQLGFDYDPDADCPTFRQYLNSSLVDANGKTDFTLVHLVWQAIGYSMTARTDLKASFWLVGKPDSGKSTFIAFLRLLMGSLHATLDLNQLGKNDFLLADAVGKRIISFTEGSRQSVVPDWIYKTIVGGADAVYANVKNKPAISFVPKCKFWWAMNEMPRVNDRSGATFNRLYIIPFNRSVPKSKRIQDLHLKLYSEAPGIFNDAMNAYKRLMRAGRFEDCEQSLRLRQKYQYDNDIEAMFFDEQLELNKNQRIQYNVLYQAYRNWCIENGYSPKGRENASEDFARLGLHKSESKVNGVYWWYGANFIGKN